MDLTQGTAKQKRDRSRKMLLWFGIVSLIMAFAALTSAYIVSSKRDDWLQNLELPSAFYLSTVILLISSVTYILAKYNIKKNQIGQTSVWLLLTLGLGIAFIALQFVGFSQMIGEGHYFTGPTSNVRTSYTFAIAALHIAHVAAGIISLVVVIFNHLTRKYSANEYLGLEMGASFWHFLDILWIYLILFMTFVN